MRAADLAAALAAARLELAHEQLDTIDVNAIALFMEDADGADFRFVQRHALRS